MMLAKADSKELLNRIVSLQIIIMKWLMKKAWRSFHETPTGETDPTIVVYRRGKELPPDFEPFNIDRFLAEKLLKELDIDPKFAIF
ncbi:unnamed protein product [Haemonchus placei]|uniref:Uncharacterized protein n=1 Tax=Haemonchus placei TaxID=6290 RepID=A0A0N4WG45_HAEPC|nr:unnamed protein product [Haemonchus placei]